MRLRQTYARAQRLIDKGRKREQDKVKRIRQKAAHERKQRQFLELLIAMRNA